MSIVIDSSGWIEFFGGLSKANQFSKYILGRDALLVPTLVLFEVYKKVKKVIGEEKAIYSVTQMQRGSLIDLDPNLALYAADISLRHNLAMADSIVYSTALFHKAKLITGDNDFKNLPDVVLI